MRVSSIAAVAAAVFLIAGCQTPPERSGTAAGTGATAQGAGVTSRGGADGVDRLSGPLSEQLAQVGDRVFFAFDQYALTPEARRTVEGQAGLLSRHGGVTVRIEGHADERGTREYNLALGDRRAHAVKDYLVALGISPARISTTSYGSERPAVLGSNEQAWAQNRRAVTIVLSERVGS